MNHILDLAIRELNAFPARRSARGGGRDMPWAIGAGLLAWECRKEQLRRKS